METSLTEQEYPGIKNVVCIQTAIENSHKTQGKPGIEKEEKQFTARLDNVVALKLETVPVGFPVPHPLGHQ